MAVAKLMAAERAHWTGTLIVLHQPNEELAGGAQAMIDDGLYGEKRKIPIPGIVLGQHVLASKACTVELAAGPVLAAVNSLSIRIWGRRGPWHKGPEMHRSSLDCRSHCGSYTEHCAH